MTLRQKTLITFAVVGPLLALSLGGFIWYVLTQGFGNLEEEQSRQGVERAVSYFDEQYNAYNSKANDWSQWDDAYQFAKDRNPDFIQKNMLPESLTALQVNVLSFLNPSGSVIHTATIDQEGRNDAVLNASMNAAIQHVFSPSMLERPDRGFFKVETPRRGIVLFVARPVVHSDGSGSPNSVLILGRFVGQDLLQGLERSTASPVSLAFFDDPHLASDYREALSLAEQSVVAPVLRRGSNLISSYVTFNDYFDQPLFILRVDGSRGVHQQGLIMIWYVLLVIASAVILLGITPLLVLERSVIRRIYRLSTDIGTIGRGKANEKILDLQGSDEISKMARDIRDMVLRLKEAQQALQNSEQRYRGMIESQHDLIVRTDLRGRFTFVNDEYCRQLGTARSSLVGHTYAPLVHPDDLPAAIASLETVKQPPHRSTVLVRINMKSGWRFISWEETAILDERGKIVEIQSVGRDITEQKEAEQSLRDRAEELQRLNRLMVGRELKMIALKAEIAHLTGEKKTGHRRT